MGYVLVAFTTVICVITGDWLLRKGVTLQIKGKPRGIQMQILAMVIALAAPLLLAWLVK